MIVFSGNDFLPHKDKFTITTTHKNNWIVFTRQYRNVLHLLNQTAVKYHYQLNSKSYPYLFLLRHYCELKLKSIIEGRNMEVPRSHDFAEIFHLFSDLPEELVAAIQEINLDNDGSCYRYFYSKEGEVGLLFGIKKEFTAFYKKLSEMPKGNVFDLNLDIVPSFSRRLEYEFTFHFNEVTSPGVFRSYYDEMTRFLLNEVIEGKIGVNDIYLPLLYLIRHSLELALKDGLMGMIHTQSELAQKKIYRLLNNEHKLSKLFTWYINLIPEDNINQLPAELQQQYLHYKTQSERLKESIHLLDSNSRYFQYPYDPAKEHLNINSETLKDIISVFLEADAYLTFNIDILKNYNIITYSDQEMASMMGYSPYDFI